MKYILEAGYVTIKKGTPCRNGVWKHRIIDGPNRHTNNISWGIAAGYETQASMSCAMPISYGSPLVGERGDSFVVSLRLQHSTSTTVRRTGYFELFRALWYAEKTRGCPHVVELENKVDLEPGWKAVAGFADDGIFDMFGSTLICLTASNRAARWRTLLTIANSPSGRHGYTPTMLRGLDCCFQCAINQTIKRAGQNTWCIIL